MALSKEWEEMHLTPSGWKEGSHLYDNDERKNVPAPEDTVLTVKLHVVVAAAGAPSEETEERTPRTTDEALIKKLLDKYGEPNFSV
jgi:hypothetical protein